jgi:hypothetical protein
MNWRIKLAAWLLKSAVVDICEGETILFFDIQRVDYERLIEVAPSTVHLIECKSQQKAVRDCVYAISLPSKP